MSERYPDKTGVAILGGGITGLATAYFASREGLPVSVFEKKGRLGGNCITYRHGDFSFDSGAHRIHDKNPVVTALSQSLIGDDLLRIDIPSQVYDGGHLLKFPFSFRNLFFHLGPTNIIRAGLEILHENFAKTEKQTFEHSAKRRYGSTVAQRFLLNYTEKLWGLPCDQLSPELSGGRLKGLDMRRVMSEILGMRSHRRDMEGAFYYPRMGIGTLAERFIAGSIGARFQIDSEIEAVYNDGRRVTGVRTRNGEEIEVDHLISTIPLPSLLRALDPPIPDTIFTASQSLRYRNLILVAYYFSSDYVAWLAHVIHGFNIAFLHIGNM